MMPLNLTRFISHLALCSALYSNSTLGALCYESVEPKDGSLSAANRLLMDGDYKAASEIFRKLIVEDKNGAAYAGLMIALAKLNLTIEAEMFGRQAKQFADNPDVLAAAAAVSYFSFRNATDPCKRELYLESASNLSDSAIEGNPHSMVAYQTLGLTNLAQGNLEKAIDRFRICLALAETPENLIAVAHVLLKANPSDIEAEHMIAKALSLNKNYYPGRLERAAVLLDKGESDAALAELSGIPIMEHNAQWFLVAGSVYYKKGDCKSAFELWERSAQIDPYFPDAYLRIADYYAWNGDHEHALDELRHGAELLPYNVTLRTQFSNIAQKNGSIKN